MRTHTVLSVSVKAVTVEPLSAQNAAKLRGVHKCDHIIPGLFTPFAVVTNISRFLNAHSTAHLLVKSVRYQRIMLTPS